MSPSPSLRNRVLDEARRRSAPTRAEVRRHQWTRWLAAGVTMVLVLVAAGGPAHSAGRPLVFTVAMAGGVAVIAALATTFAVIRGTTMLGRSLRTLATVTAFVPVATFAWLVLFHQRYTPPFSRIGYRCLALTLVSALAPLAMMIASRPRAAHAPIAQGAAFGAVAGAWAGVSVAVWCPLAEPSHVVVGHVLPLVILAVLGAFAAYSSTAARKAL